MFCKKCDFVMCESHGYGDEQCPDCGTMYYSDVEYDDDGNEIEDEEV